MRPSLARFNPADRILQNAVIFGDFSLEPVVQSNCIDLLLRQFGCRTSPSPVGRTMLYTISLIRCWRIPAQILEPVVLWVAVIMAAFKPFGARTHERSQDQGVRAKYFDFVVPPKTKKRPPIAFVKRVGLYFTRGNRSHAASVGNPIKAFKANYVTPMFHCVWYGINYMRCQ